MPKSSIIMC